MPKMAMAPGTYTFDVTNNGPSAHNLTINGPGVSIRRRSTFASGTQTLTVTLKDGTDDFYCSVPGHKAARHWTQDVTVGSGGGAAATTTEDNGGGSQLERRRLHRHGVRAPSTSGSPSPPSEGRSH